MYLIHLSIVPVAALGALCIYLEVRGLRRQWVTVETTRWKFRSQVRSALFVMVFLCSALALGGLVAYRMGPGSVTLMLFDMSASMFVSDGKDEDGKTVMRIAEARVIARRMILAMPQNSRVAIGMFASAMTKTILILPPMSVNDRYAIEQYLALVDWWNTWVDGSGFTYILDGLRGIAVAWQKPFNVVIFSDGGGRDVQLNYTNQESREFASKGIRFLIIGMGNTEPSVVPRLNAEGTQVGYIPDYRNDQKPYYSGRDDASLQASAKALNGAYFTPEKKREIARWLRQSPAGGENTNERAEVRWPFAAASFVLFLLWIAL